MTLSQLRHELRNHLNAIKLSAALLERRHRDKTSGEILHEIAHSVDAINEIITRFMGDADAPGLPPSENKSAARC